MTAYFDSGVLVKRYVREPDSAAAINLIDAAGTAVPFSPFHAVEIPNAIRLKRFRKEISVQQEKGAILAFQSDIDAGRLERLECDLPAIFLLAAKLSSRHSGLLGTRSMDILHVAAALNAGCKDFVSFDHRQRAIAAREGLSIAP